jgi:hypothetical protein
VEGSGFGLRYYLGICLEGLRKITKYLSQDSRSPGRHLNRGPAEYEAAALTTRPQHSVSCRCHTESYMSHNRCVGLRARKYSRNKVAFFAVLLEYIALSKALH